MAQLTGIQKKELAPLISAQKKVRAGYQQWSRRSEVNIALVERFIVGRRKEVLHLELPVLDAKLEHRGAEVTGSIPDPFPTSK
jgi:hypothetical protein